MQVGEFCPHFFSFLSSYRQQVSILLAVLLNVRRTQRIYTGMVVSMCTPFVTSLKLKILGLWNGNVHRPLAKGQLYSIEFEFIVLKPNGRQKRYPPENTA